MLFFRKATIHANAVALIVVWKKAFGEEHVMAKTSLIKKLEKLVDSYYNQVYSVSLFKAQIKFKANWKEMEQLNKEWSTSVDSKTGKILDKIATFHAL